MRMAEGAFGSRIKPMSISLTMFKRCEGMNLAACDNMKTDILLCESTEITQWLSLPHSPSPFAVMLHSPLPSSDGFLPWSHDIHFTSHYLNVTLCLKGFLPDIQVTWSLLECILLKKVEELIVSALTQCKIRFLGDFLSFPEKWYINCWILGTSGVCTH